MITLHACVTGRIVKWPEGVDVLLTIMQGRGRSYLVLASEIDPAVARLQVGDDVMVHLLLPERCEIEPIKDAFDLAYDRAIANGWAD